MAVSAGGDNIGLSLDPSENFTSPFVQAAAFDFSHTWVGFSMQSFAAHFEFEVTVTPVAANETGSNDLVTHLLGVPLSIPVPLVRSNNQSKIGSEVLITRADIWSCPDYRPATAWHDQRVTPGDFLAWVRHDRPGWFDPPYPCLPRGPVHRCGLVRLGAFGF